MRFALGFTAMLCGGAAQAQNQSDVFDQFFRYTETEHKAFYDGMPDETIDPFSGTLHIVHTDVVLLGKAGLDLRIIRSYSSKIWGRTDDPSIDSLLAEGDHSVLGYGWSFHMGRIKNPNASGAPTGPCSADYPVVEMPDGSARVFYRVSPSDPTVYASRDYWRMETNCSVLGGKGSCVWSNTGTRYEFSSDYASSYNVGLLLVWPVSAIVDQYGNRISISYVTDRTGSISSITDTYNRQITFTYVKGGDGTRLDTMTVNNNVYTYVFTSYPIAFGQRRFLTEVVPPIGPSFKYSYAISAPVAQNQYALNSMTYPHGGTVAYSYQSANFFAGVGPPVPFAVVSTKTVTDRGGAPMGTFTYMFSAPSTGMNMTTIVRPDGRGGTTNDVYKMFGFGAVTSGNVWQVGLTQQISRASGAEVQNFAWDGRTATPVANSLYSAPGYAVCAGAQPLVDQKVYSPVLYEKDVQRDGSTYKTVNSNWDSYGQPQNVTESGQHTRTTAWTYFSQLTDAGGNTLNLVRDHPLTQTVCVAGECFNNSWSYKGPGYSRDTETKSGVTTSFGHNPNGTLAQVTDAVGKTLTLSGYDVGHGIPTHLDFGGVFAINRTATWEGWVQTQTDGRNNTTQFVYDGIGRVKQKTPPGPNQATTYSYDNLNGTTVTTTRGAPGGLSYTVTTYLDGFGRKVATTDTLGNQTTTKYDYLGQIWFQSAAFDSSIGEVGDKFDRDSLGRVVQQTKACRGATAPSSGCSVALSTYMSTVTHIYQNNNCVETIEQRIPDSLTTTRCYASFGNPGEQLLTSVADAAGGLWQYGYTAIGHLKSVSAPSPAGNRSYEYDARQYLTGEKSAELGLITGDTVSIRYVRNAIGQVITRKDARGVVWTYDNNDGLNRLVGIEYGSSSGDDLTQSYQPLSNNLATVSTLNGGSFNYVTYDELDRLRNQQWTFRGVTYNTAFHFDPTGCLDRITYPTGSVVTQGCDAANRVTSVTFNNSIIISNVKYHPSGQPSNAAFGNGTSTVITYDDRSRPQNITSAGLISFGYQYDGLDNVIARTNSVVPGSALSMLRGYDNLNRLTSVQAPGLWGTATYQYDGLGDRQSKVIGNSSETYTYDPQTNRLATANGPDSIIPVTLSWDLAARLASSSDGSSYTYTGRGWRAAKIEPNRSTVYHYDSSGRLLSETLLNGTKLRDYIYLGDRLVAVDGCISSQPPGCSERRWLHVDALGSIQVETDGVGKVVASLEYQPWGENWSQSGVGGDRQYNGRPLDSGTGFYYYGARMFWPLIGRFISSDSVAGDVAHPQSSNVYAYVLNNPYRYTDPTGHDSFPPPGFTRLSAGQTYCCFHAEGIYAGDVNRTPLMAGVPQIELTEKTLSIPVAVVTGAAAASALEAAFLEASIWVYIRATSIFEAVAAAGNAVMRAVDKLGGGSTGGSTAERLDSLLTLQRDQASRLMLEMAETPEGREELMSIGRLAAARVAAGTVASNPEAGRLSSLGFQAMQFANLGQQQ